MRLVNKYAQDLSKNPALSPKQRGEFIQARVKNAKNPNNVQIYKPPMGKIEASLPTDAMTMTNKSLVKSIDGILDILSKGKVKDASDFSGLKKKQVRTLKHTVEQEHKAHDKKVKRYKGKGALAKSIDTFLMRKGILQKTANKSSLPLGTYQKAGDPVKRMVNNSATLQSPDVWSAGKKTTKTKE